MPELRKPKVRRWLVWIGAAMLVMSWNLLMEIGPAMAGQPAATPSQKSLYERLGGYDALVAFARDFSSRLFADPKLERFWSHRGKDGIERELHLSVDYLAAKFGGPFPYTGRDLKLAHAGMKVDEQDWLFLMKHLNATLDKFKLPEMERAEVMAFIEGTKADIVEKPAAASR